MKVNLRRMTELDKEFLKWMKNLDNSQGSGSDLPVIKLGFMWVCILQHLNIDETMRFIEDDLNVDFNNEEFDTLRRLVRKYTSYSVEVKHGKAIKTLLEENGIKRCRNN